MSRRRSPFRTLKTPLGQDGDPFAVLDIGTGNTACFIGRLLTGAGLGQDFPGADIIGAGHAASQGVGTSGIIELNADQAIEAAVSRAASMAGERPIRAMAAIGGTALSCRKIAVDLGIEGHCVLDEDVTSCLKEGARRAAEGDTVPLHIWPTGYAIDGRGGIVDPRGLAGDVLTVELTAINAPRALMRSITDALMRAHLEVSDFLAAPYAAGIATLLDDEMQLGALCLDMGARTSSFAAFENGVLQSAGVIPIGGGHITSDIAKAFSMPIEDAERLKVMNGTAIIEPGAETTSWQTPTLSPYRESQEIDLPSLAQVIAPRLEETFEMVADKLAKSGSNSATGLSRVVLTGGASQIGGAVEMAEKILGMKARLGKPLTAFGAPEATSGPSFAVCAGLVDHVAGGMESSAVPDLSDRPLTRRTVRRVLGAGASYQVPATGTDGPLTSLRGWLKERF